MLGFFLHMYHSRGGQVGMLGYASPVKCTRVCKPVSCKQRTETRVGFIKRIKEVARYTRLMNLMTVKTVGLGSFVSILGKCKQ